MFLRLSSRSGVYSKRINDNEVTFVWNTPVSLCAFTHLAFIDLKVLSYEETEKCQFISCNLVQTSVINPLGRIHATTGLDGYGFFLKGIYIYD